MPKNYKSWIAFFTFGGAYLYAIYSEATEPIVWSTGLLFLVVTVSVMLRSEQLMELIKLALERKK